MYSKARKHMKSYSKRKLEKSLELRDIDGNFVNLLQVLQVYKTNCKKYCKNFRISSMLCRQIFFDFNILSAINCSNERFSQITYVRM